MQIKQLLRDDDAVSPVIGVILMVAITVILAAVIASFVLGLDPGQSAPTASFDVEAEADNVGGNNVQDIQVTFNSGQKIDMASADIQIDGPGTDQNSGATWQNPGSNSQITTGTYMVAAPDTEGTYEVSVVWESGGSSQTIDTGTVTVNS